MPTSFLINVAITNLYVNTPDLYVISDIILPAAQVSPLLSAILAVLYELSS